MKRQYEAFEKICTKDLDGLPGSVLETFYQKCSRKAEKNNKAGYSLPCLLQCIEICCIMIF